GRGAHPSGVRGDSLRLRVGLLEGSGEATALAGTLACAFESHTSAREYIMNLAVALLVVSFVVTAKQAQESFQGEWKMVEYTKEGFSKTEDELGDSKITVKGGKMTIRLAKADAEVPFTLNPTTDPTAIDLYLGEQNSKNLVMGIYKLEKD